VSIIKLLKKKCNTALFTTPSHSQRFFVINKLRNLYKYDISETDFHNPQKELSRAENYAASVYGTKATKFLTNGSTSGIIAAVLSCIKEGDEILIWKEAHPCHKNAAILAGAKINYYEIPTDEEWGIPTKTSIDTIEPIIKNNPKIKALIVTSPTYEGIVSDIISLKKMCRKYNVYLIVDEAHGALYPFCDELPQSAVNIADFTIQSLHKTAGGLNPTALVHTNTNLDIDQALSLISTTSPSYPLLATIEANIRYLNSAKGRQSIKNLLTNIENLKKECPNCEFGGDDKTKILVKIAGLSGFQLSEILYKKYNIEDEKTNYISTMLLCGIGTDKKKLTRLKNALRSIKKQ